MIIPVVSITLLCVFIYAAVILLLSAGIRRLTGPERKTPEVIRGVTVVIPFRNESTNLPFLIDDLSKQTYPGDKFHVILINDHSTDDSRDILDSLIKDNTGFVCLDLAEGKAGKKEALFQAISQVHTRWIIQTDADCRLGPDFISSHMAFLEEYPSDLVAGLVTTYNKDGGFTEVLERLDLLSLTGTGAGSFYFGKPLMCSGANLLYSRELYFETRDLDPMDKVASGDDMFLMIGARRLGRKLSYSVSAESLVKTAPVTDFRSLVRQRIRWGSKSVSYKLADIQFVAILVSAMNLLALLTPVWIIIDPSSWIFLVPALLLKSLADFLLLKNITRLTRQARSLRMFIPVSIIYYFYLLVVLAGTLIRQPKWKERTN